MIMTSLYLITFTSIYSNFLAAEPDSKATVSPLQMPRTEVMLSPSLGAALTPYPHNP